MPKRLLMSAISYTILLRTILAAEGPHSRLRRAVGNDFKGTVSLLCYVVAIGAAFVNPTISSALYVTVVLIWLVPDRRIERTV